MTKTSRMMKSWITPSLVQAGWAPLSVFVCSQVLGHVFHAYALFPGIDKLVHIVGGMAITHFFATSIVHSQNLVGAIPRNRQLVLALALTFLVALAWEAIELIGDMVLDLNMTHGLTDTLLDILFGLLGSLIVLYFRADGNSAARAVDGKRRPSS